MIGFQNVTFAYKKSEPIIMNCSYTFRNGELYYLIGENGVGKTTLAKLILNIVKPTHGAISFEDINVISYLPDYNGIYPHLTVMENIKYRLALYNLNYSDFASKIEELFVKYHLKEYQDSRVELLSLGTQKKVAILCVAIIPSHLIILDEPTGGLDHESRNEVLNMLENLKSEHAIIICITHDSNIINKSIGITITIKDKKIYECE